MTARWSKCSGRLALLLLSVLMTACGSAPVTTPSGQPVDDGVAVGVSPQVGAFEARQRERAQQLTRQGRLADAAVAWEILTVLRPEVAEYRERLADMRRQIDSAVADRLQRATQAQRRGDADAAMQQYLAVLALQPDHAQAADALRAIERERNRRNYLGKYSRLTLTRRAIADAEMAPVEAAGKPGERHAELEHASLLASQGEYADAIALLERRVAANKRDAAATQLLADVHYQQGVALATVDRSAAATSLERAVKLNPQHARARARLAELKRPVARRAEAASAPAVAGSAADAGTASLGAPARAR